MKHNLQPLTELEIKSTNGGDGIIAYDPVTGQPFPEETGGYGPQDNNDGVYSAADQAPKP